MRRLWHIPKGKNLSFEDRLELEKDIKESENHKEKLKANFSKAIEEGRATMELCNWYEQEIYCIDHDIDAIELSLKRGVRVY